MVPVGSYGKINGGERNFAPAGKYSREIWYNTSHLFYALCNSLLPVALSLEVMQPELLRGPLNKAFYLLI
jgi:hypothetical protein